MVSRYASVFMLWLILRMRLGIRSGISWELWLISCFWCARGGGFRIPIALNYMLDLWFVWIGCGVFEIWSCCYWLLTFWLFVFCVELSAGVLQPLRLEIKVFKSTLGICLFCELSDWSMLILWCFFYQRKLAQRSERVKSVDLHPTEPWYVKPLRSSFIFVMLISLLLSCDLLFPLLGVLVCM